MPASAESERNATSPTTNTCPHSHPSTKYSGGLVPCLPRPRSRAAISTTACVALAGCGGCGSSSHQATQPVKPLQPHRQTHTGFHRAPLISIFEADRQLHEDPAGTLDLLKSLGADTVRIFVP